MDKIDCFWLGEVADSFALCSADRLVNSKMAHAADGTLSEDRDALS
jgi:hypothetical protein